MSTNEKIKDIGPTGAFVCLGACFVILGVGAGYLKLPPEMIMLSIASMMGLVCWWLGAGWDDIISTLVRKLAMAMPALFILVAIGMMIGAWIIGGTIPFLIAIGLQIIEPSFLAVTAFLVCCFISVCVGTSWGTVGTVGVALIGIASVVEAPLPIIAGAIISGAYFGDKMSPLSDTTNLSSLAAGADLYEHIMHMFWTTIPSAVVCIVVFLGVGFSIDVNAAAAAKNSEQVIGALNAIFNFNFMILLPVAVILLGSILKKPTLPVIILSTAIAVFNAMVFQGFSIAETFESCMNGFNISIIHGSAAQIGEINDTIARLLNRGGMISMANTLLLTICAFSFGAVLEVSGILKLILNKIASSITRVGGLIVSTLACGTLCLGVTSNGSITTLLIGDMFRKVYASMGLQPKNLSRTIEDSVTIVDPLIPWTPSGIFMATTLGVATLSYMPWAILCYFGYVMATFYGYTGIGIARTNKKAARSDKAETASVLP